MPRIVRVLAAVGLFASLLVGLPAQPASALGRCDDYGVHHYHLHVADRHLHDWVVTEIRRRNDGRLVITSFEYQHRRTDDAVC